MIRNVFSLSVSVATWRDTYELVEDVHVQSSVVLSRTRANEGGSLFELTLFGV